MPASITARGRCQFWHALSGLGDENDSPLLSQALGLGSGGPPIRGFRRSQVASNKESALGGRDRFGPTLRSSGMPTNRALVARHAYAVTCRVQPECTW